MLKTIKRVFGGTHGETHAMPAHELRHLHVAVAVLLHEARRADYVERGAEAQAAQQALIEMFGVSAEEAASVLEQGSERARQLTSFYAPVSVIKRDFSLEERINLVEHLWRIAFADGRLDPYEDHYVRKIAHLLYVPNTQSMLARNRARG